MNELSNFNTKAPNNLAYLHYFSSTYILSMSKFSKLKIAEYTFIEKWFDVCSIRRNVCTTGNTSGQDKGTLHTPRNRWSQQRKSLLGWKELKPIATKRRELPSPKGTFSHLSGGSWSARWRSPSSWRRRKSRTWSFRGQLTAAGERRREARSWKADRLF